MHTAIKIDFRRWIQQRFGMFVLAMFIAGCHSVAKKTNLPNSATAIPASTGVVVVGVSGNASAVFRMGTLFENGSFEHDGRSTEFTSESQKPYIVQALLPTTNAKRYALLRASLGGKDYEFECGQVLPILTVKSGAVQYYGDFTVLVDEGKLKVKQSFDLPKAQQFIDQNYPRSGWTLQQGELERARSTQCLQVPPAAIVG